MQIDKQSVFGSGRSVLHKGFDLIKEREKQKREAMRNLYYLKDITLDAFESRKAELKMMLKWKLVCTFTASYSPQIRRLYSDFQRLRQQRYIILLTPI